jgi:hypothetical protein
LQFDIVNQVDLRKGQWYEKFYKEKN